MDQKVSSGEMRSLDNKNYGNEYVCLKLEAQQGSFLGPLGPPST